MTITQPRTHEARGLRSAHRWPVLAWPIGLFLVALVGAVLLYHQLWAHPTTTTMGSFGHENDQMQSMWFLKWLPWQLVHGHNPFIVHAIDYPAGVNLAWNTATPTLALLFAPLTFIGGSALTYNVLMTLAPALTSATAFLWLRRHVSSPVAAAAGGLLIGFGPFATGHLRGHLHLVFTMLVPIILMLLEDLLWRRPRPQWRTALYLGAVTAAQFGISEELVVIIGVAVAIAVLAYLLVDARAVVRAARDVWRPLAIAVATMLILASPLLIEQFVVSGTVPMHNVIWRADGNDYFWPGYNELIPLFHHGRLNVGGAEDGVYMGLVLMIVLGVGVLLSWRDRLVWCATITLAVLVAFTFGDIKVFGLWLPWHYLKDEPGLTAILPIRFAFASAFVIAWLLARWLDRLLRTARASTPRNRSGAALATAVIAFALVTLVPHTIGGYPLPKVPRFFAASNHVLPPGSAVVVMPAATPNNATAMYIQQEADFRFVMPGGYAYRSDGALMPPRTALVRVSENRVPPTQQDLADARAELTRLHYRAIIVLEDQPTAPALTEIAIQLTGRAPDRVGDGVLLWLL